MRDGLFVLGTAVAAVVCCFGVSLLVAAGGASVLGLAGVALPVAALIGIGGWAAWHRVRGRKGAVRR
ncbi:MAG: hypothetical protein ABIP53_09920 [Candidatus Limnocylindrales bacterium]